MIQALGLAWRQSAWVRPVAWRGVSQAIAAISGNGGDLMWAQVPSGSWKTTHPGLPSIAWIEGEWEVVTPESLAEECRVMLACRPS